jgi:hypothetical protein
MLPDGVTMLPDRRGSCCRMGVTMLPDRQGALHWKERADQPHQWITEWSLPLMMPVSRRARLVRNLDA